MSLGERFGKVIPHTLKGFSEPGIDEILLLSNKRVDGKLIGVPDAGRAWHSDSAFVSSPPRFTMLNAIEIPDQGGETLFIDMAGVYQRLGAELQQIAERSRGVFSYKAAYNAKMRENPDRRPLSPEEHASLEDSRHPLVTVHPSTELKALFLSPAHLVRCEVPDGADSGWLSHALMSRIFAAGPDYVHSWRRGDLVVWDNRRVIHRATIYNPEQARLIRRISVH